MEITEDRIREIVREEMRDAHRREIENERFVNEFPLSKSEECQSDDACKSFALNIRLPVAVG